MALNDTHAAALAVLILLVIGGVALTLMISDRPTAGAVVAHNEDAALSEVTDLATDTVSLPTQTVPNSSIP